MLITATGRISTSASDRNDSRGRKITPWILAGTGAVSAIALFAWRFSGKDPYTYGSATWATVWDLYRAGAFKKSGLRLGDWMGRMGVHYHGAHALTVGCPGSNKGTSAIVPNIADRNLVLLVDPGGENSAIASKGWRERGLEFLCINPFGMFGEQPWALPRDGFNPLAMLDPKRGSFAADAKVLAEMLTPRTGTETGNATYFKNSAETILTAMIIHIVTTEPKERRHLGTLYEYMNPDSEGWTRLREAMKANNACGGQVRDAANRLDRTEAQSPEEFSAIKSTCEQDLAFLADPLVRETFMRNDVDFSLLKGLKPGQKGAVISIVLPIDYLESHGSITRLAMACAILTLQRAPLPREQVLFVIDEAAALGKITQFPNWLATLRKYRVQIWSIWQTVGQLVQLYDRNWQTIIGNCGLKQILGVADLESAEYVEKYLGRTTVPLVTTGANGQTSETEVARSLLFADEIFRMHPDKQIVLEGASQPRMLNKTPYWERPDLKGRFHPNPYYAGMMRAKPGLALTMLRTKIYETLVHVMAPHRKLGMLYLLIALSAGYYALPEEHAWLRWKNQKIHEYHEWMEYLTLE